ncbi:MCE family protein [Streptomyces gobiensis]|uniref:MCE family protein n=1 Tax=Streptomyces gobiensis TaxID=2875706 RepID=UPI001E58F5D6|nr:MCE family protein [Streptomyces gobiensis]UGY92267.1 MCE family protein [Streptomyces gobiensis]
MLSPAPTTRLRLYGIVFLIVLALLLSLTVAVYQQVFTSVVRITLQADSLGNQLNERADVKLRGLLVGEVREVRADGAKATLDLALKPEHTALIPADVHARLLPKTLFGEKYVDLVVPENSTGRPIRAGDTITQDRTTVGIELQQLMDDLLPLLRAVQPGKLNATLTAFATALEGRGDEIGDNLVKVDKYLRQLNPHMPTIQKNISQFADVTEIYDDAAPDLLRTLKNTITNSRTLVEKQDTLAAFLTRTATAANTGEKFLDSNGDRFIRIGRVSRPTLALFDRYSPQYPCLLAGLVEQNKRSERAFRGGKMRITLEFVRARPGYEPGEEPRYAERSGPNCAGLPHPPTPAGYHKLNDGTKERKTAPLGSGGADTVSATEAEQRLIGPLVAPVMGVSADEVPAAATLLFGPMARGTEVSVA